MRNATADKFPRFAVWENVPGAFSSNNGDDFRAVLEAFCSVCDDTVHVPRPADGAWQPAGCVLGDGFSIAWKVYDAQYWGVPQRRKRIYLIADFATERAKEILFEQDSMPWNPEACKRAEQNASRYVNGSLGGSDRPGLDGQVICFEPGIARREGDGSRFVTDKAPTLRADMGDNQPAICYAVENHPNDSRCTIDPDGIVQTLSSRMGTGGNNTPFVLIENREEMKPVMVLKSERKYVLRKLTPVECLRLQGLPDWWCDGVKGSDSAIYRMAGNGIALPCAYDVIGRIVEGINK